MLRSLLRVGIVLAMITLGVVGIAQAQEGLTRQDRQGPVTVTVTLLAAPAVGAPLKAKIALDTHSVGLDGIKFEDAVALRTPEGTEVAPSVEQTKGGGHHREAVLEFPPLAQTAVIRIIVKGVGGVPERSFSWEVPPTR